MTEWIVTSSVLIVAVMLLRRLLRGKISLRLRYALWALVLARLLIPGSLFDSSLSVMNAAVARTAVELEVQAEDFALPDLSIVEPDPDLPLEEQERQYEENKAQWQAELNAAKAEAGLLAANWDYLELIWYVGIALVGLALLISNLRFALCLRCSRRPVEIEDCPRPVYLSGAVETPCLFGLFRPAIYATRELVDDENTLRHVWQHELTHYRHGDHLWSLLRCVCLAVHWYNPVVWAAAYLSRRDCELACDEGTILRIGEEERGDYGRTLIRLTCHTGERRALFLTATTMTGGAKTIKERVTLIAKKPKMAVGTLIAVVLIAVVACACTFTGAKSRGEPFTDWTESLTAKDVQHIEISKYFGVKQVSYEMPEENYGDLVTLFRGITGEDCSTDGPQSDDTDYRMAFYRADKLWLFKCMEDGTVGLMFNDAETGAYFGCEGELLIIDSPELWALIKETADGEEVLDYVRSLGVVDVDNMTEEQRQRLIDAGMDGVDEELQAMHDEFIAENQPVLVLSYLEDWRCEIDGVTYKLNWRSLIGTELDELQAYGETNGLEALGDYIQDKLDGGWNILVVSVEDTVVQPTSRLLTDEEIARVNEYFASTTSEVEDGFDSTVASCFFTSYYDRPGDINLAEFLYYFPFSQEADAVTEDEFANLKAQEGWSFDFNERPIHKYSAEVIDTALWKYAGIGLEDLSGVGFEYVIYSEKYDAFYTFTSDFGPGMFPCTGGEVEDDVVRLYAEFGDGGERVLTLIYRDGRYLIQSHKLAK